MVVYHVVASKLMFVQGRRQKGESGEGVREEKESRRRMSITEEEAEEEREGKMNGRERVFILTGSGRWQR